jgi:hypothetical protein
MATTSSAELNAVVFGGGMLADQQTTSQVSRYMIRP